MFKTTWVVHLFGNSSLCVIHYFPDIKTILSYPGGKLGSQKLRSAQRDVLHVQQLKNFIRMHTKPKTRTKYVYCYTPITIYFTYTTNDDTVHRSLGFDRYPENLRTVKLKVHTFCKATSLVYLTRNWFIHRSQSFYENKCMK